MIQTDCIDRQLGGDAQKVMVLPLWAMIIRYFLQLREWHTLVVTPHSLARSHARVLALQCLKGRSQATLSRRWACLTPLPAGRGPRPHFRRCRCPRQRPPERRAPTGGGGGGQVGDEAKNGVLEMPCLCNVVGRCICGTRKCCCSARWLGAAGAALFAAPE